MKKYLRQRVDRLDAKGLAPAMTVTIEMDLCSTQTAYQRVFDRAWKQVPAGALVYCWMRPLSDPEFIALAEGRLVQPHVTGIFIKQRAPNHLFGPA